MQLAAGFNADFPAAIVGLTALVLVVSAIDAGIAKDWAERARRKRGGDSLKGWARYGPLVFAWIMLACGFTAMLLALVELRWRTNAYDLPILVLSMVPVVGLLIHLAARVRRQLSSDDPLPNPNRRVVDSPE